MIGMGIVVAVLIGFQAGRRCPRIAPETQIVTKVDTLVIRDTVTVSEPISVTRWRVDSVAFPVRDTVRVQDTLFIYLERERVRAVEPEWGPSRNPASTFSPEETLSINCITEWIPA